MVVGAKASAQETLVGTLDVMRLNLRHLHGFYEMAAVQERALSWKA
jgi:hypothetical protein